MKLPGRLKVSEVPSREISSGLLAGMYDPDNLIIPGSVLTLILAPSTIEFEGKSEPCSEPINPLVKSLNTNVSLGIVF